MDVEQIAFTIIAHAGEAKSLAYSALREAEKKILKRQKILLKKHELKLINLIKVKLIFLRVKQTEKKHLLMFYLFILRIIL